MDDSTVFLIVFMLFLIGLIAAGLVFICYQNIRDGKRIDVLINAQREEEAIQARAQWEENRKAIAEAKALEAIDRQRFPQKWANMDRMKAREARWAAKNARDRAEVEAEEAEKKLAEQRHWRTVAPGSSMARAERQMEKEMERMMGPFSLGGWKSAATEEELRQERQERDDQDEFIDMMFDEDLHRG